MSKKLIAVSLFTGAGGMDVGFERPGIKVVFANEVMKEAAQTYILIDFRAFYGLDKFSLKQIDQYVWQIGIREHIQSLSGMYTILLKGRIAF
jgi:site-specific DNA-cytosine methylase